MYYVYVIRSLKDNHKYTGVTSNIKKRLLQHNNGQNRSTKNRRPFKLEFFKKFNTKSEALATEKKYKHSHGSLERNMKSYSPVAQR